MKETISEFYQLHGMLLATVAAAIGEAVRPWLQEKSMSETVDTKTGKEREASFLAIIDAHQRIIYKICRAYGNTRADEQDLYQEIVYQLWKAYPAFKGHSKISTWVYSIALRSGIQPYRREKVRIEFNDKLPDRPSDEATNGGADDRLVGLFHRLGNIDRAVLALMMEGYNHKEIAAVLELGDEALHKRVTRIMTKINEG